ncbi:MAG: hypothetical protein U0105_03030 [Candidatus Obscuribacterales bacterium]
MSLVHRVIKLNEPFKIRGYTVPQWILMAVALGLAFLIGTKVPQDWKLGNLPVGFLVGLAIFCGAIVFISATQMRPISWWKNAFLYKLKLMPLVYLPHAEEGAIYPDPTIEEAVKREDRGYVELGADDD